MNCCPFLAECQYFSDEIEKVQRAGATFKSNQLERIKAMAKTHRLEFCASNASFCARHLLAKEIGIKDVPKDLHPSHVLRAKEIIAKHRSPAPAESHSS
jgi:hypothetical protein